MLKISKTYAGFGGNTVHRVEDSFGRNVGHITQTTWFGFVPVFIDKFKIYQLLGRDTLEEALEALQREVKGVV